MAKRGNYAAGRIRRQQILEAATLHFAQNGYYATSLASIARDIDITTAGLMHHFPTKQHLLVALADHRIETIGSWAREMGTDEDGLEFWRVAVEMSRRMTAKPGLIELFVVVAFSAADPASPIHDLYSERYEMVVKKHAVHYYSGIERGVFRPDINGEELARECIAVVDGLQLQWALSKGALDLAAATRRHHEQQLRSIVTPGVVVDLSPRPRTSKTRR